MKTGTARVIASILCAAVILGLAAVFSLAPSNGGPSAGGPISADTVMIEMADGYNVTADEYFYYAIGTRDGYAAQYGAEIFETNPDMQNAIFTQIDTALINNRAVLKWAADEGLDSEFSEADETEFNGVVEQMRAQAEAGGKTLEDFYKENNLSPELFRKIYINDILANRFLTEYMASDAPLLAVTDGEISTYISENGTLGAKHILIAYGDDQAASLQKAEDVLARVQAGEDFDALMNEMTEDPGIASAPDGYTFSPGQMVAEFENATKELAVGEVSGIVESSHGYHIIKRIEASKEEVTLMIQQSRILEKQAEYAGLLEPKTTAARDGLVLAELQPVI